MPQTRKLNSKITTTVNSLNQVQAAWYSEIFYQLTQDEEVLYHAACFDPQLKLFDYEDPRGIAEVLELKYPDMKYLSSGAYAVVMQFRSQPGIVMRLSISEEDYKGWWKYAGMAAEIHSTNQHVPDIRYMDSKNALHAAFMPLYHPILPALFMSSLEAGWLEDLEQTAKGYGIAFNDIHAGNMMMTSDCIPVLTDPVS